MSVSSSTELLAEASGVKITMTPLIDEIPCTSPTYIHSEKIIVKIQNFNNISIVSGKSCGFHLTKSKWDPYPWVGYVEHGSIADIAGLRPGDCLLKVNGTDVLGLQMKDVASLIRGKEYKDDIHLCVWRCYDQQEEEIGQALKGPLPEVTTKLVNAMSEIVRCLECPVCLESSTSPVSQCVHGHILCAECRPKTPRCPICRVRLGQGRCLLADKLHKVIDHIFRVDEDRRSINLSIVRNLRERLFGRNCRQQTVTHLLKNNNAPLKPRQSLLTKLFLGGLQKAASTENLSTITKDVSDVSIMTNKSLQINETLNERLSIQDRPKSASTGELSEETKIYTDRTFSPTLLTNSKPITTQSTLGIPQMSNWGNSTDSIPNIPLECPLSKRDKCKEIVTANTLLEHLNIFHAGPQIHFYYGKAKIPFPLPFGFEAIYILHCAEDIFFFQYEEERVWITNVVTTFHSWDWTLHGWGINGTEVKLRRKVASLEHPLLLSPKHIAPLPTALSLHTINIQLLQY